MFFHVFLSYVTIDMPLLGYYAAYSGNSLLAFQESLLVPSSRVKKSKNIFLGILYLDSFTREDWADRCPETLVKNYHYMLHNIPEEGRFHLLSTGS
jgi:hypothetical protein